MTYNFPYYCTCTYTKHRSLHLSSECTPAESDVLCGTPAECVCAETSSTGDQIKAGEGLHPEKWVEPWNGVRPMYSQPPFQHFRSEVETQNGVN